MRSKLARWFVTAAALAPFAFAAACSDDPVAETPAPAAPETCVGSLQLANGSACTRASLACDYPVVCANGFFQQTRCVCDGQRFACTFQGAPVAKGAVPECQNTTETPANTCPSTLAASEGKACTVTGKLCFFAGTKCADGSQATDVCECAGGSDAGKLTYKCQQKSCPTAPADAATPPDAASADASPDAADGG